MNRRNFTFLGIGYFFVLFNYSLVRAASTTFFVEAYGAKAAPQGWLAAVLMLVVGVWCSNRLQEKVGFHRTFIILTSATVLLFIAGHWAYLTGYKLGAFAMFAWKEVYIVLQVHLFLAYANSWLKREEFVKWIGPLGGLGSVGGVIGGLLTSWCAKNWGTSATLLIGQLFVFLPALCALALDKIPGTQASKQMGSSPLQSLDTISVRKYVASIAAIVALSQIVINIADFQFGLFFEAAITNSAERTGYLGNLYTVTNGLTLVLQMIVLPLLLRYTSERTLHFFIPLSYLLCLVLGLNSGVLLASAMVFAYLKASDYSLFSAGKELLYHPLAPLQKYGAKYLTDMFVYRASKAGIAVFLIYFQSIEMLRVILGLALILWIICVTMIFTQHRRLFT